MNSSLAANEAEDAGTRNTHHSRGIVICPTPTGGHIEHAFELATALGIENGRASVLISRPGASDYLPATAQVIVLEALPPLPHSAASIRRSLHHIRSLLAEPATVRRIVAKYRATTVVLEEPRYALPKALVPTGSPCKVGLVMHNAVAHETATGGLIERVRAWVSDRCLKGVDFVIVHGERQRSTLKALTGVSSASFDLPDDSYIDVRDNFPNQSAYETKAESSSGRLGFVCLGEIRQNKGIEYAVRAAESAQVNLFIAGAGIDREYTAALRSEVGSAEYSVIDEGFVSASKFDALIHDAVAIVLPYVQFDAQSGLISRARAANKWIVASDLPALREQVGSYERVTFVTPRSIDSLAAALTDINARQHMWDSTKQLPLGANFVGRESGWRAIARHITSQ